MNIAAAQVDPESLKKPVMDAAKGVGDRRNSEQANQEKGAKGLKLSLAHIQKYKLDEDLLSVQNYTADEMAPKARRRKTKKEKKDKEYYKQKYPGYDSDDIEFLEADFGGDDSDPKFNYSLTGSDIQMNPISEDGDQRDKMRHLEILKEQEKEQEAREAALKRKLEEEAKKKTYKTAKIQTERVEEFERSESSDEYVAPPTPTEKISEEDSKEFEYDAASDFVDKHILMGAKKQTENAAIGDDKPVVMEQESSEDLEYQAPPDSDDFMGMTEKEYVKYQQEQQRLSWFEKQEAKKNFRDVVIQAEVVDLGQQAEQDEKELRKDVKMKTKALQADLDASVDLMKNTLAAKLKERVALLKKEHKKESAIQTNLEGESLDQVAKEKEEQLERQRKLREKKQKLKQALENEQKLKEEKEQERRAQSKLNKKNLMQNKKKIREFQEQLKEQNETQVKQTHELNEKIQEMHEKYKQEEQEIELEEELNLQLAQQEVDQLAKEAFKKMEEEWKSTDSDGDGQKYDKDGNPIIKRKEKRTHRGKLNYDMNVQTEGNIDDALLEHPLDLIQQNESHYSPQPFKEMKSSVDEYEEKNQSSRLSLIPTGKMATKLPAKRTSIHSNEKVQMSPTRLQRSPHVEHEVKLKIGGQKERTSPTRSPYSKVPQRKSTIDREVAQKKNPENLHVNKVSSSPRKRSYATGPEYDIKSNKLLSRNDPQPISHQATALQQMKNSTVVNRQEYPSHYLESVETSLHRGHQLEIPQQINSRKQSNPFVGTSPDLTNDIDDLSYQRAKQNPAIAEYMKQGSPQMRRGSIGPSTSGVNFQDDGFADQIGFGDSVSQRIVEHSDIQQQDGVIPSNNIDMKGKPFASNLENAKILAQVTKRRIENMDLGPDHFNPSGDSNKELEKQKKANSHLNETLQHLNMSVDILINQYDPARMKSVRQATDKYSQLLEEDRLPQEEELALANNLNEIRNAEKQMKTTAKELQSLQKKYDRVKDWKHLSHLYKQTDEDQRKIQRLEKDNKKLRVDQKKAESRMSKQMTNVPDDLFQEDLSHNELMELDNEYKILRHKADYLQEKLFKEQEAAREQQRLLHELQQKVKHAEQEEQKISETGRRLYKVDFDDMEKLDAVSQQDQLSKQKDKILKKMVILEDGKASIDKQYAQQHRRNMQKMQQLNDLKKQMEDSLKYNEEVYQEKRQQLKFYQQQKRANETLKKKRMNVQRESQAAMSEPSRLGQFDPNLLPKVSTPAQSQLDPSLYKPLNIQQTPERSSYPQMNAAAVLSQPPSSMKDQNFQTTSLENLRLSTIGTEEGDRSQRTKNLDPGLEEERQFAQKAVEKQIRSSNQRDQMKSRAGSQRSSSKTNANRESGVNQSGTNSKMENERGFNEVNPPAQEPETQQRSPDPGLTKARLEEFDNKQKLAQAIAEQRQQTKSLAIEREEKEQKEREKSQGSQRSPRSPALAKQSQKKENEGAKANQLALKNQKVSAPKMNIEDIAIIRETLAEDDLEELTALDLEKQNFKSTISGTGAARSGAKQDPRNKQNSMIKLIDNMPTLNQIDEIHNAGSDAKNSKSKTNVSKASQQQETQKTPKMLQSPARKVAQKTAATAAQAQAASPQKQGRTPGRAAAGKSGGLKNAQGHQTAQSQAPGQRSSPSKAPLEAPAAAIRVDVQRSISPPRLDEDDRTSDLEEDQPRQDGRQDIASAESNSEGRTDSVRQDEVLPDNMLPPALQETNSLQAHNVGEILMIDNEDEQNSPRTHIDQDRRQQLVDRSTVRSPKSQLPQKDAGLQ